MRIDEFGISVIIPLFNSEKYISETLTSIISQTLPPKEIIVINDGSNDQSAEKVQDFFSNYSHTNIKFSLINQKNQGHSSAVNKGIISANQPFVALVDSDDIWLPEKLEKQISILKNHSSAKVVYCGYEFFNDEGRIWHSSKKQNMPGANVSQSLILKGNLIHGSNSSVLFHRESAIEIGLYDKELLACEDWDLWIRLSLKLSFYFIPEILVRIRTHPRNQSNNYELMSFFQTKVLLKNKQIYCKLDVSEKEVVQAYLERQGKKYFHLLLSRRQKDARKNLFLITGDSTYIYKLFPLTCFRIFLNFLRGKLE